MKLHYSNILLFALPLTILLTSLSNVYSKNKPYITQRLIPIYTSRGLSECDTESSIYDKDEEMKSVKEILERQTSQRFEEYEERMKEKRQKRKEERDKNIQKIIEKDKMEKNLAEKIEKGCLKCGCGLGGGVLPVWGLVSGLWYATWSQYVTKTAIQKGIEKGIEEAIKGVKTKFSLQTLGGQPLADVITSETYNRPMFFVRKIYGEYNTMCENGTRISNVFCTSIEQSCGNDHSKILPSITQSVSKVAADADNVAKTVEAKELAKITAESSHMYSAIGYSVLAILIIVLVMIIIYLILRYRRKKKMNKKAQYTKLLNQ
ncbi:rifin PIR protein, putative [Plasmodium reichenowi]|uniref:Rifin PIR protein, putative n=1 Tax=Plasmodium reichenowi TaxID=5854 RepID=A0A2P9DHC3_PLARE|nr:rifin PIR protein, putative [Plasmodium reichenowi]